MPPPTMIYAKAGRMALVALAGDELQPTELPEPLQLTAGLPSEPTLMPPAHVIDKARFDCRRALKQIAELCAARQDNTVGFRSVARCRSLPRRIMLTASEGTQAVYRLQQPVQERGRHAALEHARRRRANLPPRYRRRTGLSSRQRSSPPLPRVNTTDSQFHSTVDSTHQGPEGK